MGDRARPLVHLWALPLMPVVALGLACAERDPAAPGPLPPSTWEPVSGSRLTARFLLSDDGLRIFDGWFDNQRGEYCRVARGQNGRFYCFPAANPAVFSDARCQQAQGQHLECAHRYTGVTRGNRRCGNEALTLWEEGDSVNLPSRYRLSNDFCAGPDTSTGGSYVGLTTRVTEGALVEGEPFLSRASLRLGPRVIRFQDGSTAPFEMYDNSQNRACVRVETDRGIRCLPENTVHVGLAGPFYADAACTARVAHADGPSCLRPSLVLVTDVVNGCMRVREAYRPGFRLDPREVYSGADCGTGRILPGHFYQLGERIDLATFPELRLRETGSGRIRLRSYSAADDVAIAPLGEVLFDTQLGVECKVAVATDGALRCLPLTGPAVIEGEVSATAFADPGCREALARYNPSGACQGAMPAMAGVARASQKRCLNPGATGRGSRDDRRPGRWDIHRLGRRHDGPLFYRVSGTCQTGPAGPGDEHYELAEALPPETFAALREE